MTPSVDDALSLPPGPDLDRLVDHVVFGKSSVTINGCPALPASRAWSEDANATHSLFDPLVESNDLALGFDLYGTPRGYIVLGPDGKLVAHGHTVVLAMLRAVVKLYWGRHAPTQEPPKPAPQVAVPAARRKGK